MAGNFENSYLGNIIGVQRQKMKDFTNSGLKKVKQMNQRATQGSKQLQIRRKQQNNYDARLRAKYGAMYDPNKVRQQQQELVKAGYNIAVDGDWGVKSKQAWNDYQLKKNQQTTKDTNIFTSLTNWINQFKPKPYPLSTNKNEQAIIDHKIHSGVTEPYWILDRNNHKLKHMQGNKTLAQFDVMTGLSNDQDGYNFWDSYKTDPVYQKDKNFYNGSKHAQVTPAGIFTLSSSSYDGHPAFRWNEGSRDNTNTKQKTSVLFHIMPKSRQADFKNGIRNKSYGCVNLPTDALNYMINNNAVGDSIYSLPVRQGNYIYESEEEGHPLKVHYGNAPQRVQGKHYANKYDLNLNYNKGY